MNTPEFPRPIKIDEIGAAPRSHAITADAPERAALIERFGLLSLNDLSADIALSREAAGIRARGRVAARVAQACVVSGQPVPATIEEPVDVLYCANALSAEAADEVELSEADCDVLPLDGDAVDLGELAAETMGLALNPYPRLPDDALAEYRRLLMSEEEAAKAQETARKAGNPFSVLKKD